MFVNGLCEGIRGVENRISQLERRSSERQMITKVQLDVPFQQINWIIISKKTTSLGFTCAKN